jgi:tRNA pseudouridine38-40 synthase
MVRFLVGSAWWAAREKLSIAEIDRLLEGEVTSAEKAPFCAPPDGLRLVKVRYPL